MRSTRTPRWRPGQASFRSTFRAVETEEGLAAELVLGMPLESELNAHDHWRYQYTRSKVQQARVYVELLTALRSLARPNRPPDHVQLTRYSARLFDQGNTEAAFKHVQDGVAQVFDVRDGRNDPIHWAYAQVQEPKCSGKVGILMTWNEPKKEEQ